MSNSTNRAVEYYHTVSQVALLVQLHEKTIISKLKDGDFGRGRRVVDLTGRAIGPTRAELLTVLQEICDSSNPADVIERARQLIAVEYDEEGKKERHDYRIAASAINEWLDTCRVFQDLEPIAAASFGQLRRKANGGEG